MAIELDEVVPFGRSFAEYVAMFALSDDDLKRSILGCSDGPASFNGQMALRGHVVTSIDPLYEFSGEQIRQRFDAVVDDIIQQLRKSPADWVWGFHKSPDSLRATRELVIDEFLADYGPGKRAGRYVVGSLPRLPCEDRSFDLALCSHFLFLYSDLLSREFHLKAIEELVRVSNEIRIFPLLSLDHRTSSHLSAVIDHAARIGRTATIERVPYELQRGGNEMLRIR